jgi:Protein of unknown function (DUF4235)
MSGKRAGGGSKAVSALTGAAAAFVARKLLIFGWKKFAGKEPPEHPEDPQVALGEALVWGVVLGVGVSTARMLAIRAATARSRRGAPADGTPPV